MADITLGKTQITVNKNGFGCLPVQRVSVEEAVRLLRKARENGINSLIRRGPIRTVKKSWEKPSAEAGTEFFWRPKPHPKRRKASGRIWKLRFRS